MRTLNVIFLSKYDLLVKHSVADRITYLEKVCIRHLNHADIGY